MRSHSRHIGCRKMEKCLYKSEETWLSTYQSSTSHPAIKLENKLKPFSKRLEFCLLYNCSYKAVGRCISAKQESKIWQRDWKMNVRNTKSLRELVRDQAVLESAVCIWVALESHQCVFMFPSTLCVLENQLKRQNWSPSQPVDPKCRQDRAGVKSYSQSATYVWDLLKGSICFWEIIGSRIYCCMSAIKPRLHRSITKLDPLIQLYCV